MNYFIKFSDIKILFNIPILFASEMTFSSCLRFNNDLKYINDLCDTKISYKKLYEDYNKSKRKRYQ
jgi:hypothetical protein